jgi:hypothetical protein
MRILPIPVGYFEFFIETPEEFYRASDLFHSIKSYCGLQGGILHDSSVPQYFDVYNSPINKVTFYFGKGNPYISLTVENRREENAQKIASKFIQDFNNWRQTKIMSREFLSTE